MRYKFQSSRALYSDLTVFISIIQSIIELRQKVLRRKLIHELLMDKDLISIYINKDFATQIFKHIPTKILDHEFAAAIKLTEVQYDVIFAPKGMFKRGQKRFDIFVIQKDGVLINADLKTNFEPSKNAIYNLIKSGGKQADHIVLDIRSSIPVDGLVSGLKEGLRDEKRVKSVMLFYKKHFFNLDRNTILSKRIYKLLK
jgi:hypothetical protein